MPYKQNFRLVYKVFVIYYPAQITTMTGNRQVDLSNFKRHIYHSRIFLDFDIQEYFNYAIDRAIFRYYEPLRVFLDGNSNLTIYLTNNAEVINFQYFGDNILVNVDHFIDFCDAIGHSTKDPGRVKAFFGQHIGLSKVNSTEEERSEFIKANLTERDLVNAMNGLSDDAKSALLDAIVN